MTSFIEKEIHLEGIFPIVWNFFSFSRSFVGEKKKLTQTKTDTKSTKIIRSKQILFLTTRY